MTRSHWLIWLLGFAIASAGLATSQEGGFEFKKKKGKDKGNDEYAKMAKLIEKSQKKSETERDKVIKELSKLNPDEPLADDFGAWFNRVSTSRTEWDRRGIQHKQIYEIFERVAGRLQIESDTISRDQFLRYAQTYWRPDQSPPWKDAKEMDLGKEVEKLFNHLDRDRSGYLSPDEMPEALRAELRRWDKNGDGVIQPDEYAEYFPQRLQRVFRDYQQAMAAPERVIDQRALDERPMVIRAGKLPSGLPVWFEQLDTDRDGQVALYEWRRAGWPLDEFAKLDLNDDGVLVPEELLKLLAITLRDGSRPYAYLLEKQGTPKASVAKSPKGR